CGTDWRCIARNLVERFFNKTKQCRRIATRYDKLAANWSLRLLARECQRDAGPPPACGRALRRDRPAMRLRDSLRDRKPEPGSFGPLGPARAVAARAVAAPAHEFLEDAGQDVRRYA